MQADKLAHKAAIKKHGKPSRLPINRFMLDKGHYHAL